MTACTRLEWYIEFHVLRNGVWNVRFVFCLWIAPPPSPPHSLSFGDWHIQLTNARYVATLHYYPILSAACQRSGTSDVIWGCFLLVSVSRQKTYLLGGFSLNKFLSICRWNAIHLITNDWDPHYIRERARACACVWVFMHVNKDKR